MKLISELTFEVEKNNNNFVRINDSRANGFGFRIGQHGFVFGWDRKIKTFRFAHHAYKWYE